MSTYFIGDIHGCYSELISLLKKIEFSPHRDILWLTGDLVARGPNSLEVLRYIKSLGDSVRIVLGNHDLHLLAVYAGVIRNNPEDRITSLLKASDVDDLLKWLRFQPLLQIDEEKKIVMVHAGIAPKWDLNMAKKCAHEIENVLTSDSYSFFLANMYKSSINNWKKKLRGMPRLRFISNVFTRIRYCSLNGKLDMYYKDIPENAPLFLKPWFSILNPVIKKYNVIFGHWSSLRGKGTPKNIYALDTGCCWGSILTCLRWEDKSYFVQPSKQKIDI